MFSVPHHSKNDSETVRSLKLTAGTKKPEIISIILRIFKKFLIRNCQIRNWRPHLSSVIVISAIVVRNYPQSSSATPEIYTQKMKFFQKKIE